MCRCAGGGAQGRALPLGTLGLLLLLLLGGWGLSPWPPLLQVAWAQACCLALLASWG